MTGGPKVGKTGMSRYQEWPRANGCGQEEAWEKSEERCYVPEHLRGSIIKVTTGTDLKGGNKEKSE